MKRICEKCNREMVGASVVFAGYSNTGMHPKCLVQSLRADPSRINGRIPAELLGSEILQGMLESISEDPSRGTPIEDPTDFPEGPGDAR